VQAGPHGSTFVAPSSVPPSHAKAPLETANWGNAQAT
jgi:hypothetical protein